MHIDHTELEHAARAFVAEDRDLASLVNRLLGKIDDLGDIYGDDDAGRAAKAGFATAREKTAEYSGALCAAYGAVGVNLALMSTDVGRADWDGIAALPRVDRTSVPRFTS
ncbi:hypothetical protein OG417_02170 [Actinoallomurus sp. NBC_01490]|jgi:hypothetical protein|uniref:hypothetical protein n=1 Tax=Actinoallomurus sp. NBC_01490 TaxID=2903557 RepID=UPI002E321D01|nr:hypothetical protein [Actinoallomurus sp. NBC_01490]